MLFFFFYRNYTRSLDITVDNYNTMKMKTTKVEYDLIADELKEIDLQLERAEHALNWNSENIWSYIENLRLTATDLSKRVARTQKNVEDIAKLMKTWKDQPLYMRTANDTKINLLDIKGNIFWTTLK